MEGSPIGGTAATRGRPGAYPAINVCASSTRSAGMWTKGVRASGHDQAPPFRAARWRSKTAKKTDARGGPSCEMKHIEACKLAGEGLLIQR